MRAGTTSAAIGRARLSLSELAAAAGVGNSTLSQTESGRANPSMETLRSIATALGVPSAELVSPHAPEIRVGRAARPGDVRGPRAARRPRSSRAAPRRW